MPNDDPDFLAKLDLSPDEIRRFGRQAVEFVAEYCESIRNLPVSPDTNSQKIRREIDRTFPENGEDFDNLLEVFREQIVANSRHNGHPRFFGYVSSPGAAVAAIADFLASALNQNVTSWRSSPAATEIERQTINWIKTILGCDENATGVFTSGGSMANFAGLAAAVHSRTGGDLLQNGIYKQEKPFRVYLSEEGHYSIVKAAGLLGIGKANAQIVGVNERFQIDPTDLIEKIEADLKNGFEPLAVVASAGTVSTGAFDSLAEVAEIAEKYNLWFHVDASYGGFAALAPSAKPLFAGIAAADSISLDPHKWLYLPVDCGCVLYKNAETARAAFAHTAEYTRVIAENDEAFAFWDYTPELSRRFRALKVWMMLRFAGTKLLGASIEHDINCAKYFARLVEKTDDFELLAPIESSIFCFRYVPSRLKKELENADSEKREKVNLELNRLNERIMIDLQRDGNSYLSNASVNNRFALRGCIINYRTTERDLEILLEDVRRIAGTLDETH